MFDERAHAECSFHCIEHFGQRSRKYPQIKIRLFQCLFGLNQF